MPKYVVKNMSNGEVVAELDLVDVIEKMTIEEYIAKEFGEGVYEIKIVLRDGSEFENRFVTITDKQWI